MLTGRTIVIYLSPNVHFLHRSCPSILMTSSSPVTGLSRYRTFFVYLRLATIGLAVMQAWTTSNAMNPDGISYLDLAEAYAHGRFADTLNLYWSPLYPAFLGFLFTFIHPDPRWEFAFVHAVNVV